MEIERKYLITQLPDQLFSYPCHQIEQGYLSVQPVVRIRRQDDDYILTYKGGGMMVREEYNLPLSQPSYDHLKEKIDGILIQKKRYCIPFAPYTIELDVFEGVLSGIVLAEVEFPSEEAANQFTPPEWFREEVTFDKRFHNSFMALSHNVLVHDFLSGDKD